jgi:hypothetical protein
MDDPEILFPTVNFFSLFPFEKMNTESDELVIVDLGELSNTRFGESIQNAAWRVTPEGASVVVDSGITELNFQCKKDDVVGTYVIYDDQKQVIGTTRSTYRVHE